MTLWSPDTCACQITLSDPSGTPLAFVAQCSRHAATGVNHSGVLSENQNKNHCVNAASAAVPTKIPTPDILPFVHDAANHLTITVPLTLTAAEFNKAQTEVNKVGTATLVQG